MTTEVKHEITTQAAEPVKLLEILKRNPNGIDCYDATYDVGGVCWILPETMDAGNALIWMLAERIDVVRQNDDSCIIDIASFVETNYNYIKTMNLAGWTPKFSDSGDRESNIEIGIQMIEAFVTGNHVEVDALKFVAYLDPFIDSSVRIVEGVEE